MKRCDINCCCGQRVLWQAPCVSRCLRKRQGPNWIFVLSAGPQSPSEHLGNNDSKRLETEAPSGSTVSSSHINLNFPLPGEKGPSCLVKVCVCSFSSFIGVCLNVSLKIKP